MLIIRMASLIERTEFAPWVSLMTDDEVNAIRTIRNIVAHAGYATMNDDIFWNAVTVEVPEVVERLLKR
ncbi:toxin-antitoxin system, antitoxin component domain protein [Brevibacterium atlanticum]|uniref:toxin-antitoxin system, antitoxin component domain protein n=1 Tax=Brevibacterium atlanticum TaxID=2697563 RepID=UPI0014236CA6|nr:toxin-antitoxin system, antitoxin component domain protein [Brevibacterium atlanticum]